MIALTARFVKIKLPIDHRYRGNPAFANFLTYYFVMRKRSIERFVKAFFFVQIWQRKQGWHNIEIGEDTEFSYNDQIVLTDFRLQ